MVDSIWNERVVSYRLEVFRAPILGYDRYIQLRLANLHTVVLEFPSSVPEDYLSLGVSFHSVKLPAYQFGEIRGLLQTEAPVYFTAYELGNPPIRFAGLSTGQESVGEGLVDSNSVPS